MKAEIMVMQQNPKAPKIPANHQNLGKKHSLREDSIMQTPGSQTSGRQDHETMDFCCWAAQSTVFCYDSPDKLLQLYHPVDLIRLPGLSWHCQSHLGTWNWDSERRSRETDQSWRLQGRQQGHVCTKEWAKGNAHQRRKIGADGEMKPRCHESRVPKPHGARKSSFSVCWNVVLLRPRDSLCLAGFPGAHCCLW